MISVWDNKPSTCFRKTHPFEKFVKLVERFRDEIDYAFDERLTEYPKMQNAVQCAAIFRLYDLFVELKDYFHAYRTNPPYLLLVSLHEFERYDIDHTDDVINQFLTHVGNGCRRDENIDANHRIPAIMEAIPNVLTEFEKYDCESERHAQKDEMLIKTSVYTAFEIETFKQTREEQVRDFLELLETPYLNIYNILIGMIQNIILPEFHLFSNKLRRDNHLKLTPFKAFNELYNTYRHTDWLNIKSDLQETLFKIRDDEDSMKKIRSLYYEQFQKTPLFFLYKLCCDDALNKCDFMKFAASLLPDENQYCHVENLQYLRIRTIWGDELITFFRDWMSMIFVKQIIDRKEYSEPNQLIILDDLSQNENNLYYQMVDEMVNIAECVPTTMLVDGWNNNRLGRVIRLYFDREIDDEKMRMKLKDTKGVLVQMNSSEEDELTVNIEPLLYIFGYLSSENSKFHIMTAGPAGIRDYFVQFCKENPKTIEERIKTGKKCQGFFDFQILEKCVADCTPNETSDPPF